MLNSRIYESSGNEAPPSLKLPKEAKIFKASYQFIFSPVLTVLGHLKRGFHKKGVQVCVKKDSDQGLRVAKVMSLLAIFQ